METIVDANVFFRTLISQGSIILLFFDARLHLFAPEKLKQEFLNNKEEIMAKSELSEAEFDELAALLFERITFVLLDEYKAFLPEARRLLGNHLKDEDFIALCLLKKAKLWTYEKRLWELGFGISTKEIAIQIYNS